MKTPLFGTSLTAQQLPIHRRTIIRVPATLLATAIAAILAVSALSGCGQKRALMLPEDAPPATSTVKPATAKPTSTPAPMPMPTPMPTQPSKSQ